MTPPPLIVGTGPTELHAHIDLDHRTSQLAGTCQPAATIVATTEHAGHWSVVAEIRPDTAGEGQ